MEARYARCGCVRPPLNSGVGERITLARELPPTVARAVGAALGALHAPEAMAPAAGVRELDSHDAGRARWLQRGLEAASGLRGVDPAVDRAIAWLGQPSLPFPPFDGLLRLIHHDLSPEHLLVASTAYVGHEP